MIYNVKNKNCIWYHSIPADRVDNILQNGLLINSKPTYQSEPESWIYLANEPFYMDDVKESFYGNNSPKFALLEIDLSNWPEDKAGWPFGIEEELPEQRWQLRILNNIPSNLIRLV